MGLDANADRHDKRGEQHCDYRIYRIHICSEYRNNRNPGRDGNPLHPRKCLYPDSQSPGYNDWGQVTRRSGAEW